METQSELASSDGNKVESSSISDQVMSSEETIKNEKDDSQNVTVSSSSSVVVVASSAQENTQTTTPTTVIATRQRMITTQGHITEIAVPQDQEVSEDFEQYQITASGDDQNVYTYETTPNGIIIQTPPDHHPAAGIVKRDIMIEKDGSTINVVNAEPQTVYVELKNDEQTRYIPNAIRYEASDRFHHRFAYPGLHGQHPPPPPPHYHPREIALKQEQQQGQEIQIFEAEHGHQNSSSNDQQNNIQEHSNEQKTHYTNLEPATQSSYYISTSENYQPTSGNGFTYLTQPSKESPYVYHHSTTGSPVLYKGECDQHKKNVRNEINFFLMTLAKHQQPPHYAQVYENNSIQSATSGPHQVYYKSDPQYWSGPLDYNTTVRNFSKIRLKSIIFYLNPELWWSNHHFGESIDVGLHCKRSSTVAN